MTEATPLPSFQEQTVIPDAAFPINCFHVGGSVGPIIPPHWHDHLEWIAIVRGGFRVQVGAAFVDLHEGEVAFVSARQMHAAFPIEEGSELFAAVFSPSLLRNSSLDLTESKYIIPMLQEDGVLPSFYQRETVREVTERIHRGILRIVHLFRERPAGSELLIKGELFSLLGYAFQCSRTDRAAPRIRREHILIQPLLQYLSQHFREPLSVEQAARICCVSPNHLCYAFKRATGKTLLEYIHALRIHEAGQLLRTRSYTVQQVALEVGYTNMTYFGRMFRRMTGMTPGEYMHST
jgi:AraC-like DNA-binding protein/quercetin dioxygenase-like cupin family protein